MRLLILFSVLLASLSGSRCAVITGACDRDVQCGVGMCCAVSLWLRGLRMCTPQGFEGDECHPFSHKLLKNNMQRARLKGICSAVTSKYN
ncbi:Prokineticin-1 [Bagarius yarrelli]|uniref:Prokineticin-1 n=1 Tax=Bagarius yarrelli TaxID=175774 RepID=A0A556V6P9_BAGYA|nr:Prokineticin-1 [Bagarius yarrelli]